MPTLILSCGVVETPPVVFDRLSTMRLADGSTVPAFLVLFESSQAYVPIGLTSGDHDTLRRRAHEKVDQLFDSLKTPSPPTDDCAQGAPA